MRRGASVVPILHTVTWKCLLIMWLNDPLCWLSSICHDCYKHTVSKSQISKVTACECGGRDLIFRSIFSTAHKKSVHSCTVSSTVMPFWCYVLIRVPANLGHATTACFTMFFSSSVIYKNITQRRIKLLASLWQIVCHLNLRCSITRATLP